ncbi:hypothetical protein CO038_03495 [Candidatus Pacearchaeota archaeon CG_4_9_14_0_2_um_filter_39_13]|nr:hypothetical protein [Candidatus Pacearchaeota archaeon]OIO43600.1 MAG: hypothetical protein AUJ64_01980 [Candidatus Pacearchaeota archaeon CG1_02_39_14]PJC44482.1 MAG: hypothetical protein CO038_03495 [Candidatus Pacearchaeota archaeon CG_4_9_14_0_2_um_filter_39_13]
MEENQENQEKKRSHMSKWVKRVGIGALATGLISGTFYNGNHDLPPLYVRKTEDGGGIAAGLIVRIDEGVNFYGAVVAPIIHINGNLYGINANLVETGDVGKVNGLEIGALDAALTSKREYNRQVNGVDIGFFNSSKSTDGLRIGLFNLAEYGRYLDVGLVNIISRIDKDGEPYDVDSLSIPITISSSDRREE